MKLSNQAVGALMMALTNPPVVNFEDVTVEENTLPLEGEE